MNTTLAGRYQLLDHLATHGSVRVYRALDTEADRPVIVRIMAVENEEDFEALFRFQQEGVVISTLKHPNLWEVYSTFLDGPTSCIVAEAIEGKTLSEILESAPLPLSQAGSVARQVASALVYVHARGVLHRDIHPDNIVILANGHVKVRAIMELGVARILRQGASMNTISLSQGKLPYYVAPEHVMGRPVDGRVDIYALGAVMYHMVTGRPPFTGSDAVAVATAQVRQAPEPPSSINPDLPPDWDAVILKALAKNPADRFLTAESMEQAIVMLNGVSEVDEPSPPVAATRICPRCGHQARGKFCGKCGMKMPSV